MIRRSFLAVVVAAVAIACSPWKVVRQSSPNQLSGARKFALGHVQFEGMKIAEMSESQWLSPKGEKSRASWATDKQAFEERFHARLTEQSEGLAYSSAPATDDGVFLVQPKVVWIQPGVVTESTWGKMEIEIDVGIYTSLMTPVDEITIRTTVSRSFLDPSIGQNMRSAGEDLGEIVAKYLVERTGA